MDQGSNDPHETDDPTDVGIRPSVRSIGFLSGADRAAEFPGVLPAFEGVLIGRPAAGADRPSPRGSQGQPPAPSGGPSLEYLTLGPLVVRGLGSRRDESASGSGALDGIGSGTGRSEPTQESDSTTGDSDRLTVREYIREQSTDSAGSDDRTESGPDDGDRDRSPDQTAASDVARTVVERWEPPTEGEDRASLPETDPRRAVESPRGPDEPPSEPAGRADSDLPGDVGGLSHLSVRSTGQGTDAPGEGTRPSVTPPDATESPWPTGPANAPDTGGSFDPPVEEPGGGRPELVVRNAGLDDGTDTGRSGDVDAGRREPTAERGHQDTGASERVSGSRGATPAGTSERQESGVGPDSEPSQRVSLESIDGQALDRFVEKLSRKLDRRERIERERRGL